MRLARTFALVVCLLGCGTAVSNPPAGNCPSDLPTACPSAPSYMTDVAPAITATCFPCHQGSAIQQRPYDSYVEVAADRDAIRTQLLICQMPPAGSPQLTAEQRKALLQWLVCAAPNN
jgi:hypothetical protein